MKAKELHDKTTAELKEEEARLRKELFDLKFKQGTRQLIDTAAIDRARKDIARVATVLNQKNREASNG